MNLECKQWIPMIPSYLDGELSEAQAGPLRKHLLDCHGCRSDTQAQKAFKRWFVPEPALAIPPSFAAHVARRAFAGDTGQRDQDDLIPRPARSDSALRPQGNLLQFVLQVTAAVAVVLIMLSIGIRNRSLPESGGLMADDTQELSLGEILKGLDGLPAESVVPVAPVPPAPEAVETDEDSEDDAADQDR